LLQLATAVAVFITGLSWFGKYYWFLELLTHFRMQFVVGAVILVVAASIVRSPWSAAAAIVVAAANLVPMFPFLLTSGSTVQASQDSVRIMSVNVRLKNNDYDAVLGLIDRERPDIVGLQEVDAVWLAHVSLMEDDYPYRVLRGEEGAYGLALFSRFPLYELETSPYVEDGIQAAVVADVEMLGTRARLILTHLMAPMTAARAELRNRQLEEIAGIVKAHSSHESILFGDLNITPWSPFYRRLERETQLANAAYARGYRPTWHSGLCPVKIPIDHILVSDGLRTGRFRTLDDIGSDHLPIVADIAIARSTTHPSE
jgi:endonuclease/exonuclease/phosphatase (EEP) superfamily protein YafD